MVQNVVYFASNIPSNLKKLSCQSLPGTTSLISFSLAMIQTQTAAQNTSIDVQILSTFLYLAKRQT